MIGKIREFDAGDMLEKRVWFKKGNAIYSGLLIMDNEKCYIMDKGIMVDIGDGIEILNDGKSIRLKYE